MTYKALFVASALAAASFTSASFGQTTYSEDHYQWCAVQHENYDKATNTYVDPSGGRTKPCASPYDDQDVVTIANPTFDPDMEMTAEMRQQHVDWCLRVHKSYRPADNTYPVDQTATRKQCSSPYN